MDMTELRAPLTSLVQQAADAILEVYARPWDEQGIEAKADDSPLTEADLASHRVLAAGLPGILDVPVVSEEGDKQAAGRYWLVDPLDGTKEFVKRNGEFTVNVALIDDGRPVLGIVQVPVTGVVYFGVVGQGAWKHDGDWAPMQARPVSGPIVAVVSKSHRGEAVDTFLEALRAAGHEVSDASYGSSLKLCKVAEGSAHIYPRLGPTMPWDTAAAHAVVVAAGGTVTDIHGEELRYAVPDRLNPWFLVGGPGLEWARFCQGIEELRA